MLLTISIAQNKKAKCCSLDVMSTIVKQKTDPKRKLSISKDIGHVKDVTGSCPAYYADEKEERK